MLTAGSILKNREKAAAREFTRTGGVEAELDAFLNEELKGFYGTPLPIPVSSIFIGNALLWPFILDKIREIYCSTEGGFVVSMSDDNTTITFSKAPATVPAAATEVDE